MGEHLVEQNEFDASELPDLVEFQSLFSDITNRADPEMLAEMGIDIAQLDRSMAVLEVVSEAAGPRAGQAGRKRPPAGKLLAHLAVELGLPETQLTELDAPGLLDRLPKIDLEGGGLNGGAVARVRMMTLLVSEARGRPVVRAMLGAFARKYRNNAAMMDALRSALVQTGQSEARRALNEFK